jgi:signal transduction histidine kinase
MMARLDSAFKKITQLTADASHELRTPVALIRTTAELTSPSAAISMGSLLCFAPWASDRQKRKDGMATKRREDGRFAGVASRCRRNRCGRQ